MFGVVFVGGRLGVGFGGFRRILLSDFFYVIIVFMFIFKLNLGIILKGKIN